MDMIGIPGKPWGKAERAAWRRSRRVRRSHAVDVVQRVQALSERYTVDNYGSIDNDAGEAYPLFGMRSLEWSEALPTALITGGVHGYETSGVTGALGFLERSAHAFGARANLLVVPCVSPWGWERMQRWNADAIDPNRAFIPDSPALEAAQLMRWLEPWRERVVMHIDLHETTDSDESEFRPMLAARDGLPFTPGTIPDGFYLVDDSSRPTPPFQQAILRAVAAITHIAEADEAGELIGSPMVAPGVIEYDCRALGLCAGLTAAPYVTTTEVYPDSPRTTPAHCEAAQVAAVQAGLEFVLGR